MILVLKSPCTIISPSLADPPTPHLLFSSLPSSFKSFSVPINPVINVTTLPPRFFLSMETRRLCLFLSRVTCSSSHLTKVGRADQLRNRILSIYMAIRSTMKKRTTRQLAGLFFFNKLISNKRFLIQKPFYSAFFKVSAPT